MRICLWDKISEMGAIRSVVCLGQRPESLKTNSKIWASKPLPHIKTAMAAMPYSIKKIVYSNALTAETEQDTLHSHRTPSLSLLVSGKNEIHSDVVSIWICEWLLKTKAFTFSDVVVDAWSLLPKKMTNLRRIPINLCEISNEFVSNPKPSEIETDSMPAPVIFLLLLVLCSYFFFEFDWHLFCLLKVLLLLQFLVVTMCVIVRLLRWVQLKLNWSEDFLRFACDSESEERLRVKSFWVSLSCAWWRFAWAFDFLWELLVSFDDDNSTKETPSYFEHVDSHFSDSPTPKYKQTKKIQGCSH